MRWLEGRNRSVSAAILDIGEVSRLWSGPALPAPAKKSWLDKASDNGLESRRIVTKRFHIQDIPKLIIPALLLALGGLSPEAQAQLTFGARASASGVLTNTLITYTISITNFNSSLLSVQVTNRFSSAVQNLSSTNTYPNSSSSSFTPSQVVTDINSIQTAFPAIIEVRARSASAVSLTNFITVALTGSGIVFETNLVVAVTNPPVIPSDLAVTLDLPAAPALVNDHLRYDVTVRNLGTNTVNNVRLTNALPAGVIFREPSATNQAVISVGTLTNGASRKYGLSVQPTNSGALILTASVGAAGITDINPANNTATNTLVVQPLVAGQLLATNRAPAMVFNPQNSLMEQPVRLVNIGTNTVDSARVIVTGLTNWLRNAVGTNNGDPYVIYGAPLNPGQGVDLLLQYFVPTRLPVPVDNTQYVAAPMPALSLAAPTNYSLVITNHQTLPSQAFLIEFPAVPGRTYTILYDSNAIFSTNALAALPPIVAQADKVQWIDDGPPKTISHPSNTPSRFYRVWLNP